MGFLNGKQILFVGIGFYDYEQVIKKTIEAQKANVHYFNSCPKDFLCRLLSRIKRDGASATRLQKLRTRELRSLPKDNDIVFVIKGDNLSRQDITYLRTANPRARFILYLWDSLVRHSNLDILFPNFDCIWSFDRKDCLSDVRLRFRPLFYRKVPEIVSKNYYLSFIGWMHSDRLTIVRALREQLQASGKSYYMKLYMGAFSYFFARYITRSLGPGDRELITLKTIPYDRFKQITAASCIVLDIAHPLQSGLTMRTIEALAAGCHLLTTNADIMNYPQIPVFNYTVFDRECPVIPEAIAATSPISYYFSIETFIKDILDEK